jgi:hypothetical protein
MLFVYRRLIAEKPAGSRAATKQKNDQEDWNWNAQKPQEYVTNFAGSFSEPLHFCLTWNCDEVVAKHNIRTIRK